MSRLLCSIVVLAVVALGLLPAWGAEGQPSSRQFLDPLPDPLEPAKIRTSTETNRLNAVSLFATARLLERNREFDAALRRYQRAYRYDPEQSEALRHVILLTEALDRRAELARYAVDYARQDASDGLLLLWAIVYLKEEDRHAEALSIYRKAVKEHAKKNPVWVELHKLGGELFFLEGKFPQAAAAFGIVDAAMEKPKEFGLDDETLELIQGDAQSLYLVVAEAYLAAHRLDDAAKAFARAAKFAKDEGPSLYGMAKIEARRDKPEAAIEKLESYFEKKLSSQGTGPYKLFAKLFKKIQPDENPQKRLAEVYEKDSENTALAYYLAEEYLAGGKLDEAEKIFKKLASDKPSSAAYRGLAHIYRKTNRHEKLLEILGEAVGMVHTLAVLGDEAKAIYSNRELVKAIADAARQKNKEQPKGLISGENLAVAMLAMEADLFPLATEFYQLAVETDDEKKNLLLLSWALDLLMKEKYEDAIEVFRRGLKSEGDAERRALSHYYLAGVLVMTKQFDDALATAKEAAALREGSPEFEGRIGWTLYRARKIDEAIPVYKALIKKYDSEHDSPDIRDALLDARLTLSHLHVLNKDFPKAEELLEQVLDEFPDSVGAKNDLGYLWAEQGKNLQMALDFARAACDAEPKNEAYRDSLGWVYLQLGRHEEAVKELSRAAAGDEPDGVILDHLGDAYQKLGKRDQAIEQWRRAVKAFEKEEEQEQKKKTQDKIDRASEE